MHAEEAQRREAERERAEQARIERARRTQEQFEALRRQRETMNESESSSDSMPLPPLSRPESSSDSMSFRRRRTPDEMTRILHGGLPRPISRPLVSPLETVPEESGESASTDFMSQAQKIQRIREMLGLSKDSS